MNKPTLALSLAAGLLGGTLSRYLTPIPVLAQAPPPAPSAAAVQTLKLPVAFTDQAGNIVGSIALDYDGKANIKLYDNSWQSKNGAPHVLWTARGVTLQPATGQ
jgi:hypothetical protein